MILKHVRDVAQHYLDGVNHVEALLYKQILSAIGKEVSPQDFADYLKYYHSLLSPPINSLDSTTESYSSLNINQSFVLMQLDVQITLHLELLRSTKMHLMDLFLSPYSQSVNRSISFFIYIF